jgi:hypothetical protein
MNKQNKATLSCQQGEQSSRIVLWLWVLFVAAQGHNLQQKSEQGRAAKVDCVPILYS